MAGLIHLGSIVDPAQDVLPTTGAHGDIRVIPQFGPRKGQKIDPETARSLLQNVRVGEQGMPLVEQRTDGNWAWNYPITSKFGPRTAPTAGASSFHGGIDIGIPQGSKLTYKGYGNFTPGEGMGILSTTDAQGNPYDIQFLHTKPGAESSVSPTTIPTYTDGMPGGVNIPGGSVIVQNFDLRPESKTEKSKKKFELKDYMMSRLLKSALDPMAGMNFLQGYPATNPTLAGMMDGTYDGLFGF
jgi:hypothetical protein|tara:strand:- start:381 stop:1106 length:726 start_codon:yes stop_codon:yes gene_type:complete